MARSGPSARRPAHRIDDLVREVSSNGWLAGRVGLLIWGFGGFLIGAIFWQAIGFWGILGEAVVRGLEPKLSAVVRLGSPARLPNCTTLALNRSTGRTSAAPCARQLPLMEEARLMGRQDLAMAEAGPGDVTRALTSALGAGGNRVRRDEN
ncbi:MAG: hypothetical protein ACK4TL_07305 [Hyphomicrobiaceae bacterium]